MRLSELLAQREISPSGVETQRQPDRTLIPDGVSFMKACWESCKQAGGDAIVNINNCGGSGGNNGANNRGGNNGGNNVGGNGGGDGNGNGGGDGNGGGGGNGNGNGNGGGGGGDVGLLRLKTVRIMLYAFFVFSTAVMVAIWTGTRTPELKMVIANGLVFVLSVVVLIGLEFFHIHQKVLTVLTVVPGIAIIVLGVFITIFEAELCKVNASPSAAAPSHAPIFPPSPFSG